MYDITEINDKWNINLRLFNDIHWDGLGYSYNIFYRMANAKTFLEMNYLHNPRGPMFLIFSGHYSHSSFILCITLPLSFVFILFIKIS